MCFQLCDIPNGWYISSRFCEIPSQQMSLDHRMIGLLFFNWLWMTFILFCYRLISIFSWTINNCIKFCVLFFNLVSVFSESKRKAKVMTSCTHWHLKIWYFKLMDLLFFILHVFLEKRSPERWFILTISQLAQRYSRTGSCFRLAYYDKSKQHLLGQTYWNTIVWDEIRLIW